LLFDLFFCIKGHQFLLKGNKVNNISFYSGRVDALQPPNDLAQDLPGPDAAKQAKKGDEASREIKINFIFFLTANEFAKLELISNKIKKAAVGSQQWSRSIKKCFCRSLSKETTPTTQIKQLPNELILEILFYLKPFDLVQFQKTCHHFKAIAEDRSLWKSLCENCFPISSKIIKKQDKPEWKQEFVQLYSDKVALTKFYTAARWEL